jgi:hypothetical protein
MAIPLGKHRDTKGHDVRPLRDAAESDRGVWLHRVHCSLLSW